MLRNPLTVIQYSFVRKLLALGELLGGEFYIKDWIDEYKEINNSLTDQDLRRYMKFLERKEFLVKVNEKCYKLNDYERSKEWDEIVLGLQKKLHKETKQPLAPVAAEIYT